jgi:hypothetical protein
MYTNSLSPSSTWQKTVPLDAAADRLYSPDSLRPIRLAGFPNGEPPLPTRDTVSSKNGCQRTAASPTRFLFAGARLAAHLSTCASLLLIVYLCAAIGTHRAQTVHFNPINGDFQNYNPIRRLIAGQHLGADFNAYLGIGPTYLIYLTMLPFGSDFATSLFASHFVCPLVYVVSMVVLCRLCVRSWPVAIHLGALTACLCLLGEAFPVAGPSFNRRFHWLLAWLSGGLPQPGFSFSREMLHPGNSLLGLRSAAPILAALAIGTAFKVLGSGRTGAKLVCLGTVAGTVAVWSNDFSLPSVFFMIAMTVCFPEALGLRGSRFCLGGGVLLLSALTALGILTLVTSGHPLAWFEYNYLGVAQDQFWYYLGPKFVSVMELPFPKGVMVGLVCLAVLVVRARARDARPGHVLLAMVLASHLAAGVLTCAGAGKVDRYFFPLYRVLFVVTPYCAALLVAGAGTSFRQALRPPVWLRRPAWANRGSAECLTAACLLPLLMLSVRTYERATPTQPPAPEWIYVPELGGLLPQSYDKAVALGREIRAEADERNVPADRRLYSTYTSALDVIAGARSPTRNDYLIHALGARERRRQTQDFLDAQPLYVTTIRADHTYWEHWLRTVNWDLYLELIRRYEPVDRTTYNTLWAPRTKPFRPSNVEAVCTVRQEAAHATTLTVHLPKEAAAGLEGPQLLTLEVEYRVRMNRRGLLLGVFRQYLAAYYDDPAPGVTGLPLDAESWRLPLELAPGQKKTVRLVVEPSACSVLSVGKCSARTLLARKDLERFRLARLHSACWNDDKWSSGVAAPTIGSGFRVTDGVDLEEGIKPGTVLKFAGSGTRTVKAVKIQDREVWVDGPPLDPSADGFPHAIEIHDPAPSPP